MGILKGSPGRVWSSAGLAVCTDGTVSAWQINPTLACIWSCSHILTVHSSPCLKAPLARDSLVPSWCSPVSSTPRNTLDFYAHHLHFLLFLCYRTVVAAFSLTPASHLTEVLECISVMYFHFNSCRLLPSDPHLLQCFLAVRLCLVWSLYTSSDLFHNVVGIQNMLEGQYLMSLLILCKV